MHLTLYLKVFYEVYGVVFTAEQEGEHSPFRIEWLTRWVVRAA
jgi:hypothetical protein